jgi:hypothetical protein
VTAGPRHVVFGTGAIGLATLGLVDPTMRALVEMQYQFDEPFTVDSSKTTLGVEATPLGQALADTRRDHRDG